MLDFFPITPKGCGGLVTEYRDQRVMISEPYSTNDQLGSNVLRLARCGNFEKDSTKNQLESSNTLVGTDVEAAYSTNDD
ncbi:hypothetical protein AVEN_73330-1 [Araneus ventricosus]|uniref:Uncharacterized protein n=1 Tax=Araneus ventricosus TaxID=182803 RepID=A0A4Y2H6A6_ARAVE|nr:hypothetical protein AVEN_73330-1 [Araneus ventricosus]